MNFDEVFRQALGDFRAGRFDRAEKDLRFLAKQSLSGEGSASVHQLLGMVCASAGNFPEAVKAFRISVAGKNDDASVFSNLCACLLATGAVDEAVAAGEKAVLLAPDDTDSHYNLADALKRKGDLPGAVKHYRRTVALRPDLAEAHNSLGVVLRQLGYMDKAIDSFRTALKLSPENAAAHNNLGTALRSVRNPAEAISSFLRALEIRPENAQVHCNLGRAYQDIDNPEKAIASFSRALEIQPDLKSVFEDLGHLHRDIGQLDAAIEKFDHADTDIARSEALRCLFAAERYDELFDRVRGCPENYELNIGASAVCTYASEQLKRDNPHPFCPDPQQFLYFGRVSDHVENPEEFIDGLIDELQDIPGIWNPLASTTQSGFQTQGNLFDLGKEKLSALEAALTREVMAYRDHFADRDCLLIKSWPTEFNLNAHSVRLQESGHQTAHIHAGGWLSGVVYLQLVESDNQDEGAIVFGSDGYGYPLLTNEITETMHRPARGDIVLFPSSLFHRTVPIGRAGERIIIAFDLVPCVGL